MPAKEVVTVYVIIGTITLFVSILVGYTMHHGKIGALIQPNEFVIMGGAAFSSLLASTSMNTVKSVFKDVLGLLKPDPFGKAAYSELLQFLYEVSNLARREGLLALEPHIERPEDSSIISKYAVFKSNHHITSFFTDSMRLVTMGGVGTFELQEMMEADIETFTEEVKKNSGHVTRVGDAMPGFGICAAVLGIVITMQAINGPPEKIGEKVGAALVGTFLGILLCYGVFQPLAIAMDVAVFLSSSGKSSI
jgi:chemotaxis protein MotA